MTASPGVLAAFWAELLAGQVAFTSGTAVAVKTDRVLLTAMQIDGYEPPTWRDGGVPKQMHLDLAVDDLDVAETEALRLGATRAAEQPAADRRRILIDPAGHPFCLSTQIHGVVPVENILSLKAIGSWNARGVARGPRPCPGTSVIIALAGVRPPSE